MLENICISVCDIIKMLQINHWPGMLTVEIKNKYPVRVGAVCCSSHYDWDHTDLVVTAVKIAVINAFLWPISYNLSRFIINPGLNNWRTVFYRTDIARFPSSSMLLVGGFLPL